MRMKFNDLVSPSHTVGFEPKNRVVVFLPPTKLPSPSHPVGLEHEMLDFPLYFVVLSPSHPVGLEQAGLRARG